MSDKRAEVEIVVRTDYTEIRMTQEFLNHDDIDVDETMAESAAALGNAMSRFINPSAQA